VDGIYNVLWKSKYVERPEKYLWLITILMVFAVIVIEKRKNFFRYM